MGIHPGPPRGRGWRRPGWRHATAGPTDDAPCRHVGQSHVESVATPLPRERRKCQPILQIPHVERVGTPLPRGRRKCQPILQMPRGWPVRHPACAGSPLAKRRQVLGRGQPGGGPGRWRRSASPGGGSQPEQNMCEGGI